VASVRMRIAGCRCVSGVTVPCRRSVAHPVRRMPWSWRGSCDDAGALTNYTTHLQNYSFNMRSVKAHRWKRSQTLCPGYRMSNRNL